jgi:hypothetical protein
MKRNLEPGADGRDSLAGSPRAGLHRSPPGRELNIHARKPYRSGECGGRQRSLARLAGLTIVLLLSTAAVAPLVPGGINPYDEGLVAYGAEQVLQGHPPAADFYCPYGPGVFYVVAAAYRLFGIRLLVERWVAGLLLILIGGVGYTLLVERGPAGRSRMAEGSDSLVTRPAVVEARRLAISAVTAVLAVLLLLSWWWYPSVNSGALALILLSGLALQRGLATGSPGWASLAGALAGAVLLWRLAFGAALLMTNGLSVALAARGEKPDGSRWRRIALPLLVGAAILVALPIYVALVERGGKRTAQSLFVWPLVSTQAADLSWPFFTTDPPAGDDSVLAVFASLTHGAGFYYVIVALALVGWRLSLRSLTAEDRQLGLWLLLLLPPLFLYANGRTDYVHVTPLLTISLLLGALAVDSALDVPAASPRWRMAGLWVWIVSMLLLAPTALFHWRDQWNRVDWTSGELPGPRGAGVYASARFSHQYRALFPQLRRHVAPGQAIFSGTLRHDRFLTNDNLLYFLAERPAATYFWCLDAGVTTSPPVQEQMVRELTRQRLGAAVLWLMPGAGKPSADAQRPGARRLDEWLRRQFTPQWDSKLSYLLAAPRTARADGVGGPSH